jgi:hypothetical protein
MNTAIVPAPAAVNILPTVKLVAGGRIAVPMKSGRAGTLLAHDFTIGSVAAYAAEYGEDVEAAVARAEANGHELYFAVAEGVTITAHREEPVARVTVQLGAIIEIDGNGFQVRKAPNDNLELLPFGEN